MLDDLCYAVKVFRSVVSGYDGLAWNSDQGWELIGDDTEGRFDMVDYPYYVCAQFKNGRHIPLPLILGDTDNVGPIQKLALRVMFPANKWIGEDALACLQDCAEYQEQWRSDQPMSADEPTGYDESVRLSAETLALLRGGTF